MSIARIDPFTPWQIVWQYHMQAQLSIGQAKLGLNLIMTNILLHFPIGSGLEIPYHFDNTKTFLARDLQSVVHGLECN
jgi:hypothetical protein